MEEVVLKLIKKLEVPLEAEQINPENFVNSTLEEIKNLQLFYGNSQVALGEIFTVQGEKAERIVIVGDLKKVKKIGYQMQFGQIVIQGSVGMHLGAHMSGGQIIVEGNAGDWVGAQMTGGLIIINGDCGDLVGAAYRGEKDGMNKGTIIIKGNAGTNIGEKMRRGLIVVTGDVGDFPGSLMRGGTIVLLGKSGVRPGAGMNRGTIISFQPLEILPTFRYCCEYSPSVFGLIMNEVKKYAITTPDYSLGILQRYLGDITELGKGELLVWKRQH